MNKKKRNFKEITKNFFRFLQLFDKKQKIYLFLLLPVNILFIVLEFSTLILLAFLLSVLLKPEWVQSKPLLQELYRTIDFSSYNYFVLFLGSCSIILFSVSVVAKYSANIIKSKLQQILSIYIQSLILKNIFLCSYEWFLTQDTGSLITATKNQSSQLASFMLGFLSLIIIAISLSIIFTFLFIQDPVLILIFAIFIGGLSYLLHHIVKNRLYAYGKKTNQLHEQNTLLIREILTGIIDIKLHRQEKYFFQNFYLQTKNLHNTALKQQLVQEALYPILNIFLYSGILTFITYNIIFYQSLERVIASGAVFLAISYRGLPYVQNMLNILGHIQNLLYGVHNLQNLGLLQFTQDGVNNKISFNEKITLQKIAYNYPNNQQNIFKSLSLTITKNKTVGLIGKTGCGKSTLAKLILGILPVSAGNIFIDKQPLVKEYMKSWYAKVGYVSQKIFIFNTSLLENIAVGQTRAEQNTQKIQYIVNLPWMKYFIASLPQGINTTLQEDGKNLSGGQIQRIAIARAIYKDPEVFIFDEATNALDNNTEKLILDTINNLRNKKTIIIIAHRLSTLKICDSIYHMQEQKLTHYTSYEMMLQKQQ